MQLTENMEAPTLKHLLFSIALVLIASQAQAANHVSIIAAENFYGDIAGQIAGADAVVTSILSNPDQDPHLFEASPSVARKLSDANVVIYNGVGYDPWISQALSGAPRPGRKAIAVGELINKRNGDNPHIWYSPETAAALAKALTGELIVQYPQHSRDYQARLEVFLQSLEPINTRISDLRASYSEVAVTATEPVYGYVLNALNLQVKNQRFQLSVMNETEPRASDVAAFQYDLENRSVKALVYNQQTQSPLAQRMLSIARQTNVPTVSVSEMQPGAMTYQAWIAGSLDSLEEALKK
ncbi:metal ABC transporter solute-binding protein, Zn/Mn family [Pseudomonas syringae]|uniref:metal ABC transporter solute-binding protein, Zn/Mn family n=1 Tax=Pseudomonas syringae TaxID=317 RepID=UPI001F2FA472|nr:zinc ABC transporter substrate-binding protein [Pseudomonas syringae]